MIALTKSSRPVLGSHAASDAGHIFGLPERPQPNLAHASFVFPQFSCGMLEGVPDGTKQVLVQQLRLKDGTVPMPLAFIRIVTVDVGEHVDATTQSSARALK